MAQPEPSPNQTLRRLVDGYQVSQAIHVAATLGIADLVAKGPRSVADLAEVTRSDPPSLYRLLRALASVEVLREEEGERFALGRVGEGLRSEVPDSLRGWAAFIGRPAHWNAWGHLAHSVETGENAFRSVHGVGVWEYRAEHPEENAIFDEAMTSLSARAGPALLDAYDFGRFGTLVDVGGGRGALLGAILARHPSSRGVLFDQAQVVADAGPLLDAVGVSERCQIVAGSFFESVPEGGDAYILKSIIHDWEDPECVAILRTCRPAVPDHGAVLVVERVLGPPNEDRATKFSDLNMLVGAGGRERTVEEFAALFDAAGFRLSGVTGSAGGFSVIEGAPV